MDEKYLSKYFSAIYRKSKREFNTFFEDDHGIKATQGDILMFLNEHPGLLQKEIASQMAIDTSLLVRNLKSLESQGLVVRSKGDDLRANAVDLTSEGKRIANEISKKMTKWWQEFFNDIPSVDKKKLIQDLLLIYEKMRTLDR